MSSSPPAAPQRLTLTHWLIVVIAIIGFAFDTYELLVMPLINRPFFPLYVGQYGKGRVVGCQWHLGTPDRLDPRHDGIFYVHCVQWLAGRAIESGE